MKFACFAFITLTAMFSTTLTLACTQNFTIHNQTDKTVYVKVMHYDGFWGFWGIGDISSNNNPMLAKNNTLTLKMASSGACGYDDAYYLTFSEAFQPDLDSEKHYHTIDTDIDITIKSVDFKNRIVNLTWNPRIS